MQKLRALIRETRDLLLTFDPGSPRIKVFGRPDYSGGPQTKAWQLLKITAQPGESYSKIVCLSAVRVPLWVLRWLKFRGAKVLVNQNGVAYPLWYPQAYRRQNRYFKRLGQLADHVHFQSQFALSSFVRWVGPPNPSHSILYNGVDLQAYYPSVGPRVPGELVVAVFIDLKEWNRALWSKILSLIEEAHARGRLSGVRWKLIGKVHDVSMAHMVRTRLDPLFAEGSVEFAFDIPQEHVPEVLGRSDLLLHLVYNDVCPNKVLEAMACGLPVIGVSAGGTAELVGYSGMILPLPQSYEQDLYPENEAIFQAIEELSTQIEGWKVRAIARAKEFSIDRWLERIQTELSR